MRKCLKVSHTIQKSQSCDMYHLFKKLFLISPTYMPSIDIGSFLLALDNPDLLFSPATLPSQELMQHDRQPMEDEDSDHLEIDQVESDEGGESDGEPEPPFSPPAHPLEDQKPDDKDDKYTEDNNKKDEEEKQSVFDEELPEQTVATGDMEGFTEDPQSSPLKQIEETHPENKLLVIEDSPNPKAESAEEVDAVIRDLQKKLADAKRERMAKNLICASGKYFVSVNPPKICSMKFLRVYNPKCLQNNLGLLGFLSIFLNSGLRRITWPRNLPNTPSWLWRASLLEGIWWKPCPFKKVNLMPWLRTSMRKSLNSHQPH